MKDVLIGFIAGLLMTSTTSAGAQAVYVAPSDCTLLIQRKTVNEIPSTWFIPGDQLRLTPNCKKGTVPITYTWSDGVKSTQTVMGLTTRTLVAEKTKTFTVTATNIAGSTPLTLNVYVAKETRATPSNCKVNGPESSRETPIAHGTLITIIAECTEGTMPISYTWSTGFTGPILLVTPSSGSNTYYVTPTNNGGMSPPLSFTVHIK